jgi:hypothetical protein
MALANSLHATDVTSAIRARAAGDRSSGTVAAKALLNAVDGISKGLPHTNEAAKAASSRRINAASIRNAKHFFLL